MKYKTCHGKPKKIDRTNDESILPPSDSINVMHTDIRMKKTNQSKARENN